MGRTKDMESQKASLRLWVSTSLWESVSLGAM